ncbi:MAG TPA: hypothetical protein V6C86_23665 [Oculatellaceae cyanobacterium]
MTIFNNDTRQKAAKAAFDEIMDKAKYDKSSPLHKQLNEAESQRTLRGARLAKLLDKNFEKLDPNNDGITRDELAQALLAPWGFSEEDFTLIRLLQKYFDTIANMVDEEPGSDSRITLNDKEVLNQFLIYSDLDLYTLSLWRAADDVADTPGITNENANI